MTRELDCHQQHEEEEGLRGPASRKIFNSSTTDMHHHRHPHHSTTIKTDNGADNMDATFTSASSSPTLMNKSIITSPIITTAGNSPMHGPIRSSPVRAFSHRRATSTDSTSSICSLQPVTYDELMMSDHHTSSEHFISAPLDNHPDAHGHYTMHHSLSSMYSVPKCPDPEKCTPIQDVLNLTKESHHNAMAHTVPTTHSNNGASTLQSKNMTHYPYMVHPSILFTSSDASSSSPTTHPNTTTPHQNSGSSHHNKTAFPLNSENSSLPSHAAHQYSSDHAAGSITTSTNNNTATDTIQDTSLNNSNPSYNNFLSVGPLARVLQTDDSDTDSPSKLIHKLPTTFSTLNKLLEANRLWASAMVRKNNNFFKTLAAQQLPQLLWIGCSDSRVPANQIINLQPGEVFVHRNIANVVVHTDINCLSVLQYAVDVLQVKHIIVCGHYGCGGVLASMNKKQFGLIDNWLRNIKDVANFHSKKLETLTNEKEKADLLTEFNVANSVKNVCATTIVQNAWARNQKLSVHGWCYRIDDGIIHDLNLSISSLDVMENIYQMDKTY